MNVPVAAIALQPDRSGHNKLAPIRCTAQYRVCSGGSANGGSDSF